MKRRGLTLIELLIALSITMIMMGAFVTLFGNFANNVADSRAVIEISERLRSARNRLQKDLESVTARMVPPLDPASNQGYFEYTEGTTSYDYGGTITVNGQTISYGPATGNLWFLGDIDDVLMFTVHGRSEMFSGNIAGTTYQAADAEVAWFLAPQYDPLNPTQQRTLVTASGQPLPLYSLYRRVLLVDPVLMSLPAVAAVMPSTPPLPYLLQTSNPAGTLDLSMYVEQSLSGAAGKNVLMGNTLSTLGRHENRFGHLDGITGTWAGYPNVLYSPQPTNMMFPGPASGTVSPRYGEDIILTDVLAFDVQAFDPNAPLVLAANGDALEPKDYGWSPTGTVAGMGCFVDLGWWINQPTYSGTPTPWFGGYPPYPPISNAAGGAASPITTFANPTGTPPSYPTFDTWTTAYEAFGPSTNGLDDDGDGIVDNESERRTTAPYAKPLRAIRVTIRVYEPASQQVRQVTVVQDFLPQ